MEIQFCASFSSRQMLVGGFNKRKSSRLPVEKRQLMEALSEYRRESGKGLQRIKKEMGVEFDDVMSLVENKVVADKVWDKLEKYLIRVKAIQKAV